jgi:hypothetical protein
LLRRIEALLATGGDVLLFGQRELYHMTALVNRYATAPVRFVVGLSLIIRAFEDPYGSLEGNRLGALARLFAQNVRIYAHPVTAADLPEWLNTASAPGWEWSETTGWVSAIHSVARRLSDTCSPIFSPAPLSSLCKCLTDVGNTTNALLGGCQEPWTEGAWPILRRGAYFARFLRPG